MKKSILFVCGLALTVAASAAVKPNSNANPYMTAQKKSVANVEMKKIDAPRPVEQKAQADATVVNPYVNAIGDTYYYAPYSTNYGITTVADPAIIVPFSSEVIFSSYYTKLGGNPVVNTWLLDDKEVSTTNYLSMPFERPVEEATSPVMKTADVTLQGKTYAFVDYQYGAMAGKLLADLSMPGYDPYIAVAPAYTVPLSKAMIYSDDPSFDTENDDQIARDWFWLGSGASKGDGYKYGSKIVDPFVSTDEYTKYIDTIFVPFLNTGTMYIDQAELGLVSEKANAAAMFPGDAHIRMSIYPLDITNGHIDFENPIARAKAGAADFLPTSQQANYGELIFQFVEEDPITGAETQVPAVVDGPFVIALDEFNDADANFAILANWYNPKDAETWFLSNDSIFQLYDNPSDDGRTRNASDIMLILNAQLVAFEAPEEVKVGLEGGKISLNIPSNVWGMIVEDGTAYDDMNEIEAESDEWISTFIETEYGFETHEGQQYIVHKYNDILTITVEQSSASREGEIIIDALGKVVTIKVIQEDGAAVENTRMGAIMDGKLYNVLGVEVGEDYKGVVIRNGEKFIK